MKDMIRIEEAKKIILAERKKYEDEISRLNEEIEGLKEGGYDNNPAYKSRMNFQRQLEKVKEGGRSGELKSLGRNAIKSFVSCGDSRAAAIQLSLVESDLAFYRGKAVKWRQAA